MLDTLITLTQPWADLYATSTPLSTTVLVLHLLGLFVGGGIALGADRRVLLAEPGSGEAYLAAGEDLRATHGVVLLALAITVLSGVGLATSDVGTFAISPLFWSKMAVFLMLIINGAIMRRTETQVITSARSTMEHAINGPDPATPWNALRRSAWISLVCWMVLVVLGVVLGNT
ncbi:MAG TPA: hypothetical protein VGE27_10850 [Gemmatimonas sp.]|uniref:hypothetical protein n=1 Tax=Gemmatimonas sp. TaxID=1962908 RepID=UPI002EDB6982